VSPSLRSFVKPLDGTRTGVQSVGSWRPAHWHAGQSRASMLAYFGALAAAQSHSVRALRLAGASESLAASAGAVTLRLTRAMVERWLDKSRRDLGPKRSAACWAEGHAMTRERAIEYALKG
jgi:hypothetical protein